MGCGSSSPVGPLGGGRFVVDRSKPGQDEEALGDFLRVGLPRDAVDKLFGIWARMDTARTGHVDLEQFYRHFRLDRSPFSDRVFSVLDADGSGSIDFREFVLSLWNFCSMDGRALMRFAFLLFDPNATGRVPTEDLRSLIREVYGAGFERNAKVQTVIREAVQSADGHVNFDEFKELNKRFPNLLFPAFTMQQALREAAIGPSFWEEQHNARMALAGPAGAYSIWDVLQARDTGKGAQSEPDLAEMRAKRWKPAYHKEGDYVPDTGGDSRAKATARRNEVYAGGKPGGMADEDEDEDGGDDGGDGGGGGGPSTAQLAVEAAVRRTSVGGVGGGGGGQRRNSVGAARRNSQTGAVQRRASISGQDTSAAAQRRGSVGTGVGGDRRQSLVGTSNTRTDVESQVQAQPNRQRRRSSLANAQERAAAFAMMNA
jgi:Ca2+-binding EF-hand superfamily protein